MPKTIADLTFNWIFNTTNDDKYSYDNLIKLFIDLNPDLINYHVKKGKYSFNFKGAEFSHYCYGQTLADFFEDINYQLCGFLNENDSVKLIGFELVGDNTFKIHGIFEDTIARLKAAVK